MIQGILGGFVVGFIGLFWLLLLIDGYDWKRLLFVILLVLLTFIIPMIIGAEIGKYKEKKEYFKYIESYKIEKQMYEKEIKNKSFEELEKIGIFNTIVSINKDLIQHKIEYSKWNYFYLDKSLINVLKPIELEEGK